MSYNPAYPSDHAQPLMYKMSLGMSRFPSPSEFSPTDIEGLSFWFDANNGALNSISPNTPATQGQTVRRWLDLSGNNLNADQATGANQPILAKLGAKGNLLSWSDDLMNALWVVQNGASKSAGIIGPNGETTTQMVFGASTGAGLYQYGLSLVSGRSYTISVWLRAVTGSTTARIGLGSSTSSNLNLTETWTLYTHSGVPTSALNIACVARNNTGGNSGDIYVGRSWLVENTWSPEYVPTTTTPVIPNVDALPNALRFDGVNDFFNHISVPTTSAYTEFIVADTYATGSVQPICDATTTANGIYSVYLADAKFRFGKYNTVVNSDTVSSLSPSTFSPRVITCWQSNTPSRDLRVNGTSVSISNASGAGPVPGNYDYYIGRSAASYLNGVIASRLVYNRALTIPERIQVETYLKNEFQIS